MIIESEREVFIEDDEYIVSRTNAEGIITYASDSFCELSGYERSELIGRPHSVVRHSEMPKLVFKELWETVRSGKSWEGYVKNQRKDGRFYWVASKVSVEMENAKLIGYVSVRSKPDPKILRAKKQLYQMMIRHEGQVYARKSGQEPLLSEAQRLAIIGLSDKFQTSPEGMVDKMIGMMWKFQEKQRKGVRR